MLVVCVDVKVAWSLDAHANVQTRTWRSQRWMHDMDVHSSVYACVVGIYLEHVDGHDTCG
jgi:hypothetical protein